MTMMMMMVMVMVMASDVACRKGATDDDACVYTARAGGSGGASYHTTYDDDATYDDDDGTEASDFCVDSAWRGVGRGLKSWTVVGSGSVETRETRASVSSCGCSSIIR